MNDNEDNNDEDVGTLCDVLTCYIEKALVIHTLKLNWY